MIQYQTFVWYTTGGRQLLEPSQKNPNALRVGWEKGGMALGVRSHIIWVAAGAVVAVPFLLFTRGAASRELVALALPAFLIFGDVLVWAFRRQRLDLGALRWLQFFSGWLVAGALMLAFY